MHASPLLTYILPSELTAGTANSATEALRQMPVTPGSVLSLDASQVENITSSGAQLLVSMHKSVRLAEAKLSITDYPPFFSQALADMGLCWLIHPSNA